MKTLHTLPIAIVVALLNGSACTSAFSAGTDYGFSADSGPTAGGGAGTGTGGILGGIDASLGGTAGSTTGCVSTGSLSPLAMLPADNQIAAWARSGTPVQVGGADAALYNMIDGAAPLYLDRGWVRSAYATYQQSGSTIQVAIYDMGNAENAQGLFAFEMPVSRIQINNLPTAVVEMGLPTAYRSYAWNGQYVIEISIDDHSNAALTYIEMFALNILKGGCTAATDAGGAPDLAPDAAPATLAFASVTAGYGAACGVKTDGTIVCWGTRAPAKPPVGSFTSVSLGGWPCGVKTDGTIVCWDSFSGELFGTVADGGMPVGFPTPPGSYTSVSVGYARVCAVKDDDTIVCWGVACSNVEAPPAGSFASVSSGDSWVCGVKTDGSVACWNQCLMPGIPAPASGTFTSVSVGVGFACGVRTDGSIACWGNNFYGEATPPAGTFRSVSAGNQYACGVKTDGTIACWGDNTYGRATPPSGTFASIGAGYEFACGVTTDGTLACWGNNSSGEATPPAP
jgi:hypothetical protein